jgi:hypothetical protein
VKPLPVKSPASHVELFGANASKPAGLLQREPQLDALRDDGLAQRGNLHTIVDFFALLFLALSQGTRGFNYCHCSGYDFIGTVHLHLHPCSLFVLIFENACQAELISSAT